jgi:uncharacterized membrane protein
VATGWLRFLRILAFRLVVLGAFALVAAAAAAPVLEFWRSPAAEPLYGLLAYLCHQRPSRSWLLLGSNLGLCARTFSLFAAFALVGAWLATPRAIEATWRRPRAPFCLGLLLPLVVDGAGQLTGLWTSTNTLRAATGVMAGLGLALVLAPRPAPPARQLIPFASTLWRAAASVMMVCLLSPHLAFAQGARLKLPAGTPVFLVFPDAVTSESASDGQMVALRVTRDVRVGDAVLVRAGSSATAKVTGVRRPAGWGEPGSLTVYVSEVVAVDGQTIPLSATQGARGQDKQSSAAVTGIIAGLLCLPSALWGFAIKGDEGRIAPGTEVKAYTEVEALVAM